VFRQVGGFDDGYFMYAEDCDLCYKVSKAGLKCWYLPTAFMVHHGGGSSQSAGRSFSDVMQRIAINRFIRIHQGRSAAAMYRLLLIAAALIRLPLAAMLSLCQGGRSTAGASAARKWAAILRWGLGLEHWTKHCAASLAVSSRSASLARPELEGRRK